jgi:hypothetical protein
MLLTPMSVAATEFKEVQAQDRQNEQQDRQNGFHRSAPKL